MATINLTPEALFRLVQRLQKEYGETSCSNFALDEQLGATEAEVRRLQKEVEDKDVHLQALSEKVRRLQADNEELRTQIDPSRIEHLRKPNGEATTHGLDQT
jgi:chromosome segregation ATPase